MIVRRLHLHPFAGTADHEVTFAPGLNVVLGPNEAGKTTLGNALRQVLFVSTRLTNRQADDMVRPYLPLSGGDTIRVSADLESGGQTWRITKRWGGGNSASELQLPGGGLISDPEAVEAGLAGLRGLNQGTWDHVLFAYQGGVGSSLERIAEGGDVNDLNEVLRRAVFETDGVSLEALRSVIERRWKSAFGRWDRELNRPEGGREIDHPWVNGVGRVLSDYYDWKRASLTLDEAEAYYRDLDGITVQLNAAASEADELKSWVEAHSAVAADTGKRAVVEGRRAVVAGKEAALRKTSQEWPVAEAKAAELETQATALRQRVETLNAEQAKSEAWEAAGRKRQILADAAKLQEEADAARAELAAVPKVEAAQIERLESLDRENSRLRARLDAARLGVTIRTRKSIGLETQAGLEPAKTHALQEGGSIEFQAGARALIRHADWEVEVRSGDIDIAVEETRHREFSGEAEAILHLIGAADLAEARKRRNAHQEKAGQLKRLEQRLADLLGNRTMETLRTEVGEAGNDEPARKAAAIAEDRGQAVAVEQNVARQAAEKREQILPWTMEFGSPEALLDQLVEQRAERLRAEQEMATLRPLPEGYDGADVFLVVFRRKRDALEGHRTRYNDLLVEKAGLEGRAPAIEPAEAAEECERAAAAFERARSGGESIDRIRRDFKTLRDEMDHGTLEPWLNHLSEVVAPLTRERYRKIDLEGGMFARQDGVKVPFRALSMGTRACLGLAVRLSMARYFLKDEGGFLLLDDPLVDLDPDRQEAAAAILQHFAGEKQVILLTCHPRHAEILGGFTISL